MTTRRYRHLNLAYVFPLFLLIAMGVSPPAAARQSPPGPAGSDRSMVAFAQTAPTQSPLMADVDMHIDFGFAGRFKPGYWTPILVSLMANDAIQDATIVAHTLQGSPIPGLAQSIQQQHRISLPPGIRVTVEMVIHLANAFHPLRFDLLDNTGVVLASQTLDLERRTIDGDFMVALDDSGYRWSWLETHLGTGVSARGERLGFEVVYVSRPELLPTSWLAYHGVMAVGVSSSFPLDRLAPTQTDALVDWVTGGGHFVWTGGTGLEATRGLPAERLAPVNFSGRTVSFREAALGDRYPPLPADTPLILWEAAAKDAATHVVAGTAAKPLVSRRRIGRGTAFFAAFDPYVLAGRGWVGLGSLARDMFSGASAFKAELADVEAAVWEAIGEQTLPYPGQTSAAVTLALYVGALSVVWARRSRSPGRKTGLVITLATIVLFAVLPVFIIRPAAFPARRIAVSVSASIVNEQGVGESRHYVGLRSAVSQQWPLGGQMIWTPGTTTQLAASPAGPDVVFVLNDASDAAVHIEAGQIGRLRTVLPAALSVSTHLSLRERQYRLTVSNGSETHIDHLFYVSAHDVIALGSLAPHTSVTKVMSSTLRSAEPLSGDWLSRALLAQISETDVPPDHIAARTMAALVRHRHRAGSRGSTTDDGFVVGIFEQTSPVLVPLAATGGRYDVFAADVSLQTSGGTE